MGSRFKDIPDIVYHGTTSKDDEYLSLRDINSIDITKGNPRTDFGQGFYVTSIFRQVLSFARYRANFLNRYKDRLGRNYDRPIIIKYRLDKDMLGKLRGKIFDRPDIRWAEFVFNNRIRDRKFMISDFHNTTMIYDYVYGHVADGKIARLVEMYKYDELDIEQFHGHILPRFPRQNDQLSFHTDKAVRCLEFKEVTEDEDYNYRRR